MIQSSRPLTSPAAVGLPKAADLRLLTSGLVFVCRQTSRAAFFLDVVDHVFRRLELAGFVRRLLFSPKHAVPPTPVILPRVVTGFWLFMGNLGRDSFVHALFPVLVFRHIRQHIAGGG